jgi:hypothetical protein
LQFKRGFKPPASGKGWRKQILKKDDPQFL